MGYGAVEECWRGGDDAKGNRHGGCWGGSCSTKSERFNVSIRGCRKASPDQVSKGAEKPLQV